MPTTLSVLCEFRLEFGINLRDLVLIGTLNFPQGMYLLLGAFFALMFLELGLPLPLAAIVAVIVVVIIVALFTRFTAIHMRHKEFSALVLVMCGLAFLYEGIMLLAFGFYPKPFPAFSETIVVQLGELFIATQSIWVIGITVVLGIALWYFFNRHIYGKAMRATSQNPVAARLIGVNIKTMMTLSVILSAGLGATAGIAVAPLSYVIYNVGWMLTMRGFVAAVIGGGLTSYVGAFVGGLVVGIIEAVTIGYVTSMFKDVVLFGILIVLLILRPNGLLGKR